MDCLTSTYSQITAFHLPIKIGRIPGGFPKKEVDKKEVLNKADVNSRSKPFMVIHNEQINCGKSYLLDKNKSTRNGAETALEYCKIGFLTKEEIKALLF